MCNANNPSGFVTSALAYRTILLIAVCVSFVVCVKRFYVGLHLGRQTVSRYAEDLAKVMKDALLIGNVATLARDMEQLGMELDDFEVDTLRETFAIRVADGTSDDESTSVAHQEAGKTRLSSAASHKSNLNSLESGRPTVDLNRSQKKQKINELLGDLGGA